MLHILCNHLLRHCAHQEFKQYKWYHFFCLESNMLCIDSIRRGGAFSYEAPPIRLRAVLFGKHYSLGRLR